MLRELAERLLEFSGTGWGPVVLVIHAFLEAFILPVAHDLFLISLCLARPHLSFLFALLSTIASVSGIMVGYAIGKWGGHPILKRLFTKRVLDAAEEHIHKYDFWAIAIACFTPIPVKVFAIFAGAVELNFKKLVVVAFIFRGARFFMVSALLFFYGEPARVWILDYLNWILLVVLILITVFYFLMHFLPHLLPIKSKPPE